MTTSASSLREDLIGYPVPPSPQPLQSSLTAAAKRITGMNVKRGIASKTESWQEDAWDMYDLVGEQRFLATTLANRMSQARFFVGRLPDDPTEDVENVTEGSPLDVFNTLAGKGSSFSQLVQRLGVNLFIPGDGYILGAPRKDGAVSPDSPTLNITPLGGDSDDSEEIDLDSLEWRTLSVSEVDVDGQSGKVTVENDDKVKVEYRPDEVVLIRVWRPHPRRWWQADSPTRSSLPVLRELVGLTMHISAQVDSRLAGAGLFLVPSSADAALRAATGSTNEGDLSPFAEALMEAMITPINDRSSAAALVPLTSVVPDDSIEKFRFIQFSSPLDQEARALRDEAIRRLALGQDCPPELLLGVAGMNHWGAWLVREDVVTTHLEPPLALICDAITTQFLWPVLEQQGVENFQEYVVWYDVDHMIMRPNRTQDALTLHTAGVIDDEALRDAAGFDEGDANGLTEPRDDAVQLAMDMLRQAPSLAQSPGLSMLTAQIRAMLDGTVIPSDAEQAVEEGVATAITSEDAEQDTEAQEGDVPATADDPAPDEIVASSFGPWQDLPPKIEHGILGIEDEDD